jgi:hypothetical protein
MSSEVALVDNDVKEFCSLRRRLQEAGLDDDTARACGLRSTQANEQEACSGGRRGPWQEAHR